MNQHLIKLSLAVVVMLGAESIVFAVAPCCKGQTNSAVNEAPKKSSNACCPDVSTRSSCCAPKAAKAASAMSCCPKPNKPAEAPARGCGCGKPKPKPGSGKHACPECQNCGDTIHNRGCGCGKPSKPKPKPRFKS